MPEMTGVDFLARRTGAVVLLAARHGGPISTLAVVAAAMAALLAQSVPETTIPASGLVNGVTVGVVVTILAALIPARQAGPGMARRCRPGDPAWG